MNCQASSVIKGLKVQLREIFVYVLWLFLMKTLVVDVAVKWCGVDIKYGYPNIQFYLVCCHVDDEM